jgi:hypothetical protein
MSRTTMPGRRRVHTPEDVRRWADAILDGVSGPDFKARFNLTLSGARKIARTMEQPLPPVPTRVDARKAAKVPGERSVLWFPTKSGKRRRMA